MIKIAGLFVQAAKVGVGIWTIRAYLYCFSVMVIASSVRSVAWQINPRFDNIGELKASI